MTDKELIKKWLKVKLAELYEESQCEVPEISQEIIKGKMIAIKEFLSFIDSLQEEPISEELEEEIKRLWEKHSYLNMDWLRPVASLQFPEFYDIAKYFFELGLKAQKGE